ncbi:hypothetical protein [Cryobacterium sp. Y57]
MLKFGREGRVVIVFDGLKFVADLGVVVTDDGTEWHRTPRDR